MIIYLHGFNSTPQSKKATQLGAFMASRGLGDRFRCPALPHRPSDAIRVIEAASADVEPRTITWLGSSLGGFYATYLAERNDQRAVLVNPACYPERDLAKYLGPQQNLYSGERYELTEQHLHDLRALTCARLRPDRYLLLVETGDEVLDYREALARYAGAEQVVVQGGDHTLQSFEAHWPRIFAFAGLPWAQ